MGFRIDDMIGAYKDFSRGYLFYARVEGPVAIDSNHPYLVNSTTLPAQTIEPIETNWQGNTYKIGGVTTFDTFSINFKSDTAHALRASFLNWMKSIHDPVSNIHGVPQQYFGTVNLTQLDAEGVGIVNYQLVHAWPSAVGEITLDYSSKEISTFEVTFTYQYHTVDSIFDGTPATGANT